MRNPFLERCQQTNLMSGDKVYNHEQIHAGSLGVGGRLTVTFLVAEESPLSL